MTDSRNDRPAVDGRVEPTRGSSLSP